MITEELGGFMKLEVGSPLPDEIGIDHSQPAVCFDAHNRFVILNHLGPYFTPEEVQHFREDMSIGVYQRGRLLVAAVSGNLGGDGMVVPCGCEDCVEPLPSGTHLMWTPLLAHGGVLREMRAATTNAHFSRTWHRANRAAAQAMGDSGGYPVMELLAFQAQHRDRSAVWKVVEARSRFGQ